jgi:acyl-CoA thioesterase-1
MAHSHRFRSVVAFVACASLPFLSPARAGESGGEPTSSPSRECIAVPDLVDCGAPSRREPRKPLPPECAALRRSLTPGDLTRTAERVRKGELVVLAIGSSSTSGVGTSSPDAAYPARLEHELREFVPDLEVRVVASGVGGETVIETLARLVGQIASLQPQLVIWQVGTNDALSEGGEEQFRSLVERGAEAVVNSGADLVLLNQQFFPGITKKERYERFVEIVREVGQRWQASVFGRYELMKEWADASGQGFRAMLADDAFHMSDQGHACLARILSDEIVDAAQRPALTPEIQ